MSHVVTCGIDHVVIDGVKIPYGTVVEVVGTGRSYRYFKHVSPAVTALRINGRPNEDDITVELVAPGNGRLGPSGRGSYYKVRGPLLDACDAPNKKFNIIVEQMGSTDPPTMADSVNRTTTLKGIATAGSRLSVGLGTEHALLDGLASWPAGVEGKWVAVRGTLRGEPGAWRIENPQWEFLQLADRIGQTVSLEGELAGGYGTWWFECRNEKVYLTNANGRAMTFAWGDQGRHARVTGKLLKQDRPALDHLDDESVAPLVPSFVIRGAEIKFLELSPTRDRFLYRRPIRIQDGVPVLVPEGYPSGLMGNETNALFYAGRNHEVIEYIVRNATPEACDVMARRMADDGVAAPLRLIYAAILACVNDQRGRDYLVPLKRLVLHHLAQLGDARAVTRVAKILRNAPGDYFSRFDGAYGGWSYGDAADVALDAIAKPGSDESILELIELLDVELSRFGGYYKKDDYQRLVAAHLIDLTGESFGVDADKWRDWLNNRDSAGGK